MSETPDEQTEIERAVVGIIKQAVDDYRLGKKSKMCDPRKMMEIQAAAKSASEFFANPSGLETLLRITGLAERLPIEHLRLQLEVSAMSERPQNFRNRTI